MAECNNGPNSSLFPVAMYFAVPSHWDCGLNHVVEVGQYVTNKCDTNRGLKSSHVIELACPCPLHLVRGGYASFQIIKYIQNKSLTTSVEQMAYPSSDNSQPTLRHVSESCLRCAELLEKPTADQIFK